MRLSSSPHLSQDVVDDLKQMRSTSSSKPLQTGIDFRTLERIKQCLPADEFQSAERIAVSAGVSRSTVQKYLVYLVEQSTAEEKLLYGTVGRPQKLFRFKS
jgi:two-component system CitB family response regulator